MKRTVVVASLVATLAAGCSSSTASPGASSSVPPNDIPECSDIYVEGKKIETSEFGVACITATGELVTPVPAKITCEDESELVWNDLAWGYVGGSMTLIPDDEPTKMPQREIDGCVEAEPGLGEVTLEEPET